MPGIFGYISPNSSIIENRMNQMAAVLRPEADNVSNLWVDKIEGVGLGHEALYLYLPERQPVEGPKGIRLVAHGEVRQADLIRRNLFAAGRFVERAGIPELILTSYLKDGVDAIAKINGGVSAAIWEPQYRKLTLLPDRYGMRPIFFTHKNNVFAFASEIKALLVLDEVNPALDEAAVMELLTMDMIGGDRTYVKSIRRLPFGSVLTYQDGVVKIDDSWKLEFRLPDKQRTDKDYLEEFIALSRDAVCSRLNDPRVAIALSGGLDSRYLLGLAVDRGLKPTCVTYGTKGSRDLVRGKAAAQTVGAPFLPLELENNYFPKYAEKMICRVDGLFNAFSCHAMSLLNVADQYSILALGNGIDQLIYTTRSEHGDLLSVDNIYDAFYHNRNGYIPEAHWGKWFTGDWLKTVKRAPREMFFNDILGFQADCIDNQLDSYMMQYLANTSMTGLSSISHQMDYTEPFFDYRLVEFALRLPIKLRWKRSLEVMALERIAPNLAETVGGSRARPSDWENHKNKIGRKSKHLLYKLGFLQPAHLRPPSATFADVHDLLRKQSNRTWLRNLLLSNNALERGIFKPQMIKDALDEHSRGIRNHTDILSTIATFELIMRDVIGVYGGIKVQMKEKLVSEYQNNINITNKLPEREMQKQRSNSL